MTPGRGARAGDAPPSASRMAEGRAGIAPEAGERSQSCVSWRLSMGRACILRGSPALAPQSRTSIPLPDGERRPAKRVGEGEHPLEYREDPSPQPSPHREEGVLHSFGNDESDSQDEEPWECIMRDKLPHAEVQAQGQAPRTSEHAAPARPARTKPTRRPSRPTPPCRAGRAHRRSWRRGPGRHRGARAARRSPLPWRGR